MTRQNSKLIVLIITLLSIMAVCSCRSTRSFRTTQTTYSDSLRFVSATAQRHESRVADSLTVRDSTFTSIVHHHDTVTVTNTVVRWRERVVTQVDTVEVVRVDTMKVQRANSEVRKEMTPASASASRYWKLLVVFFVFCMVLIGTGFWILRLRK